MQVDSIRRNSPVYVDSLALPFGGMLCGCVACISELGVTAAMHTVLGLGPGPGSLKERHVIAMLQMAGTTYNRSNETVCPKFL